MNRAFSPQILGRALPGASPQAGMKRAFGPEGCPVMGGGEVLQFLLSKVCGRP
jgi:hypothetical protein